MKAHAQRGGATLAIALLLALLALLTAGFVHRGLVFEQRSSVNHTLAAQAFESAEAGLTWATALLDAPGAIDSQCQAAEASSRRFVEAVATSTRQVACMHSGGAWACHCPEQGSAVWPSGSRGSGFVVTVTPSSRAGHFELQSRGCADVATCMEQVAGVAHAHATVARLPGLAATPRAALTVKGSADLREAEPTLTNEHPLGATVHAGGPVLARAPRLVSAPGAPAWASVHDGDASLAELTGEQLFANLFGIDASTWRDQPAARRIACASACDAELGDALRAGVRLLWLDGGLRLQQSQPIGSAERPVVLVVNGPLAVEASTTVLGLVHLRGSTWSSPALRVQGAVVVEGDLLANGRVNVQYDAAVLERLHTQTGSHARVPGSWRDF